MKLPSAILRPQLPKINLPVWSSPQLAKEIFQRVPAATQFTVLAVAIWGPRNTPMIYSFFIIFIHLIFVASNARTAYGMWFGTRAVEKCASTDWRAISASTAEFDRVKHLIILPHYKESLDTLRETLGVLASHPNARASYRICLASEENEAGVEEKVLGLMDEYAVNFFEITFTLHPGGLEGEAAGKSSNVAWASREMHARDPSYLKSQIITVMDADSCFASDFFACCASKFVSATPEVRKVMMFVAPIFFDRNAGDIASPVAITDILWCAAGLGTMYDGSVSKLPTSAYAMTHEFASRIGFWDAGPEAIGEDLHMSVKAFFETSGQVHVEAVFSPASQCNVVGYRFPRSATGTVTLRQACLEWGSDLLARYAQAKRHMWGSLDSGYALRRYALGINGVGSDLPKRATAVEDELRAVSLRLDTNSIRMNSFKSEAHTYSPPLSPTALPTPSSEASEVSDYTFSDDDAASSDSSPPSSSSASPVMRPSGRKNDSISSMSLSPPFISTEETTESRSIPLFNLIVLMSRLFEAHFNVGFFFMFITVSPYFNPGLHPMPLWQLHDGAINGLLPDLPKAVLFATSIASHLGTVAFLCTAAIFYNYERFHHVTTTKRWESNSHLGIRAHQQHIRSMPWCMLNYAGLPFVIIFGVIPLFHVQFLHIFSNRLTYQVSAKPSAPVAYARLNDLESGITA